LNAATVAVYRCAPDTGKLLEGVSAQDRLTSAYWALRVQWSAESGAIDPDALEAYSILSGSNPTSEDYERQMNPLWENNAQGSVDGWGYDRAAIYWDDSPVLLPLPEAGATRWMLDPKGSRETAGFAMGPGVCPRP